MRAAGKISPDLTVSRAFLGDDRALLTLAADKGVIKRDRDALRESEERYRELFENAGEPIATVDLTGVITEVNRAFEDVLGYSREELIGTRLNDYVRSAGRRDGDTAREQKLSGETDVTTYEQEFRGRDNRRVTLEVSTRLIRSGGRPVGVQGVCRDITERKRAEGELRNALAINRHQARHDALTGLPNRQEFFEQLEGLLRIGPTGARGTAVLLIDLNGFKQVNDTLGHQQGDLLLAEFASRLQSAIRGRDLVARLGGDEFGILLENESGGEHAATAAIGRIREILASPFTLQGLRIALECSIGVALHPVDGDDAEVLLQRADVAMYAAKADVNGFAFYRPGMKPSNSTQLTLIAELRSALAQREVVVHYQPCVTLPGHDIVSMEALARWNHPARGLLQPDEFIPVAELTGLVSPLTLLVLAETLGQQAAWRQSGIHTNVAVNLSVRCLLDERLPGDIDALLREFDLPPGGLTLELTESAVMGDPSRALSALQALKALGVKIALDDFGSGFTSLGYFGRLPLDQLKIDRSLIRNASRQPTNAAIVRSVVGLAHELGLEVVAEGVESGDERDFLAQLGCDLAHGFYFGRPASPDALDGLRSPKP